MGAGCQYRSRATSSTTYDYYYAPCARPKTSDGNVPSFSMPPPRFPPRPNMTYRCEPTPPDPAAHWQRVSQNPPPLPPPPPSSPTRVNAYKPVQKQSVEVWVDEQIHHLTDRSNLNHHERRVRPTMAMAMGKEELRQRMRDELVYEYEAEAHKWMNREAEMRRRAQEQERERDEARRRVVQEDIRRIQVRVRQRRDSEREVIAEERRRSVERAQEKARREQARVERAVQEAWQAYESRWAALSAPLSPSSPSSPSSSSSSIPSTPSSELLVFRDIPWPVLAEPARAAELTPDQVTEFLLHPAHSPNHSRRDRIRAALLRWHPDRFRRILNRVVESERSEVDECVGLIARCLNGLLAKEGKLLQQAK